MESDKGRSASVGGRISERLCGERRLPAIGPASGAAVAPCAWAARPTESHLSHLIPLNPAESQPRNGFHAIPAPPVPLPTGSFPSTAGARVLTPRAYPRDARLPTRHSARGAVAPSGPDGPGRRRGDADCTRTCFLAPAEVRMGDRPANARRSFFASGGRRGDANGRSLLSLSAPGGGEGRGEEGTLASVLRSGEDAPCPAAEAR